MPLSDFLVFAGFFSKEKSPVTVQVTLSGDADGGSAAAIVSGNMNASSDARINERVCDIGHSSKAPVIDGGATPRARASADIGVMEPTSRR